MVPKFFVVTACFMDSFATFYFNFSLQRRTEVLNPRFSAARLFIIWNKIILGQNADLEGFATLKLFFSLLSKLNFYFDKVLYLKRFYFY